MLKMCNKSSKTPFSLYCSCHLNFSPSLLLSLTHAFFLSLSLLLSVSSFSDVLALPIFKQEESNLPPDTENKILPFQYVLCAATSPAVKLHDETLTYLNQGLPYRDSLGTPTFT